MKNLLKAEFYYLSKNIRYYVFVLLVIAGYVAAFVVKDTLIPPIVSLVTIVFAAIIILEFSHKDFTNKTMKNYVGCGIPLWKVYFAKLLVCLVAVLLIIIISDVLNPLSEVACGIKTMEQISAAYVIVGILVNMIQATVVFFICSFIRSSVLSILVAVLYVAVLPVVFMLVHNDFLDTIAPYMSFNIQSQMTKTNLDLQSQIDSINAAATQASTTVGMTPEIFFHLCVPILIAIALTCLGAFLYSKREVK